MCVPMTAVLAVMGAQRFGTTAEGVPQNGRVRLPTVPLAP